MISKKTIFSASVLFFLGTYAYGQQKDTLKTANVEEVIILGSRGGSKVKS